MNLKETLTKIKFSLSVNHNDGNSGYYVYLGELSKIINNRQTIIIKIDDDPQTYYDINGFSVTKILHLIGLESICEINLIQNKNLPGKNYTTVDHVEQLINNINNINNNDNQIIYDEETCIHSFTYNKITNIVTIETSS